MRLEIEKLKLIYSGDLILDSLDLGVEEGEFVSILGHSGSGKTTLINIIAGLLKADGGSVKAGGQLVDGPLAGCAYMPQDDLLMPWNTILKNVTLYGRINGTAKEDEKEALRNMEAFGLKGYEYRYPGELSGGMRQRAAFLRTLLCRADLFLLDEPFAALDELTREEMQDWLIAIRQKDERLARTTLLVTHDIEEAVKLSDRIIVLSGRPARIVYEKRITPQETMETKERQKWDGPFKTKGDGPFLSREKTVGLNGQNDETKKDRPLLSSGSGAGETEAEARRETVRKEIRAVLRT
ncbi:MAG: ABC transporter ATP-binding protein [Clostridiales Family XIII bacterium]|jgi:ABC-type nitrate/sulfonate/bicarbonate transport system ATPase subunit|nr:ABC transporter ATP-binding protein [Clostridiales Family XIII bacterium]